VSLKLRVAKSLSRVSVSTKELTTRLTGAGVPASE